MPTLGWRDLGGSVIDLPFNVDEIGRIIFTLPEGLGFGQIELDGLPVTGYFTPDDPDFIWQLRPYLLAARE